MIERVNHLAAGLYRHGIEEKDIIGIYSPNDIEYPIAVFASLILGNTITTANPTYTPDELNYQLKDSRATLLITIPDLLQNVRKALHGTMVIFFFFFFFCH